MRALLTVAALAFCAAAHPADVNMAWEHDATKCADGSDASYCPVTAFKVQQQEGEGWAQLESVAGNVFTYTLHNVRPGNHCYRVLADSNGTVSDPSNVACIDIPNSKPKAVRITVTVSVEVE